MMFAAWTITDLATTRSLMRVAACMAGRGREPAYMKTHAAHSEITFEQTNGGGRLGQDSTPRGFSRAARRPRLGRAVVKTSGSGFTSAFADHAEGIWIRISIGRPRLEGRGGGFAACAGLRAKTQRYCQPRVAVLYTLDVGDRQNARIHWTGHRVRAARAIELCLAAEL